MDTPVLQAKRCPRSADAIEESGMGGLTGVRNVRNVKVSETFQGPQFPVAAKRNAQPASCAFFSSIDFLWFFSVLLFVLACDASLSAGAWP